MQYLYKYKLSITKMPHINSIISIDDLTVEYIKDIMYNSFQIKKNRMQYGKCNKVVGHLFFEPSTRTKCSFQAATYKIGGNVINYDDKYSSSKKGETIEDTIRTMEQYCDALVIRHPEKGMIKKCSSIVNIPVINAGDGDGEHPTQALLDLFTIMESYNQSFSIALCGDLKYSRTVHSLIKLLDKIYNDIEFIFVSCPELDLDEEYKSCLTNKYSSITDIQEIIETVDIIYMTRIQKERISEEDIKIRNVKINNELLKKTKHTSILMHPLPRNDEITSDCDKNHRSKYFDQMNNGVYVRMALLSNCFKESIDL